MTYVKIVFVIVFLAVGAITIKRSMEIQKNGIEADAVVSRIEADESAPDEDGHTDITYIMSDIRRRTGRPLRRS